MESFKIVYPSVLLAPYVKHYWMLESDDLSTQRIIPTGNVELIFHRGNPLIGNNENIPQTSISGQSFTFTDLIPTGKVNMIAVVFHPFGARAFFNMPICELTNMVVAADDIDKTLNEVEDRILNSSSDNESINLIEDFLLKRLNPYKEYNYNRLFSAINTININDSLSVINLADAMCLNKKQAERLFNDYIGISPKKFMRIVRFQRSLYMLQNNPKMNFTQLAYNCDFYDQPHMINEFKLLSGYSPSQYISICAPNSDYFSF